MLDTKPEIVKRVLKRYIFINIEYHMICTIADRAVQT